MAAAASVDVVLTSTALPPRSMRVPAICASSVGPASSWLAEAGAGATVVDDGDGFWMAASAAAAASAASSARRSARRVRRGRLGRDGWAGLVGFMAGGSSRTRPSTSPPFRSESAPSYLTYAVPGVLVGVLKMERTPPFLSWRWRAALFSFSGARSFRPLTPQNCQPRQFCGAHRCFP